MGGGSHCANLVFGQAVQTHGIAVSKVCHLGKANVSSEAGALFAEVKAGVDQKVKTTMAGARKESEFVMFEAFSKLLEQQKLKPSQVRVFNS